MIIKFSKHPFSFWCENMKYRTPSKITTWTSIWDIGKKNYPLLKRKRYFHIENKCFLLIKRFLKEVQIPQLTLTYIEYPLGNTPRKIKMSYSRLINNTSLLKDTPMENIPFYEFFVSNIKKNMVIDLDNYLIIEILVKLITREFLWAKLEGIDNTFIHFGYDMYYYIGSDRLHSIRQLKIPFGIYAKEINQSPYSSFE